MPPGPISKTVEWRKWDLLRQQCGTSEHLAPRTRCGPCVSLQWNEQVAWRPPDPTQVQLRNQRLFPGSSWRSRRSIRAQAERQPFGAMAPPAATPARLKAKAKRDPPPPSQNHTHSVKTVTHSVDKHLCLNLSQGIVLQAQYPEATLGQTNPSCERPVSWS